MGRTFATPAEGYCRREAAGTAFCAESDQLLCGRIRVVGVPAGRRIAVTVTLGFRPADVTLDFLSLDGGTRLLTVSPKRRITVRFRPQLPGVLRVVARSAAAVPGGSATYGICLRPSE